MATKNKPITRKDDLNDLILSRVKITGCVLGQGSFGTVYKAEHNGTACAAKQVDLNVKIEVKTHRSFVEKMKQNFLLECLRHSELRHPNIVKMLGVFYPKKRAILPYLVMELMENNLTQLLQNHQNICMYVKLSILQDVSRGLCYLHTQNPPIVHQALYSDNILLTKGLIAKIGDFKTGAETISDQALLSVRPNRMISDFLPNSQEYDLPLNVFSFGCVVCHVVTQQWPVTPVHLFTSIPNAKPSNMFASCTIDDWCVEKHHKYIFLISDNLLRQLAEACLQQKSKYRPHMSLIYDRITRLMAGMVPIPGIRFQCTICHCRSW